MRNEVRNRKGMAIVVNKATFHEVDEIDINYFASLTWQENFEEVNEMMLAIYGIEWKGKIKKIVGKRKRTEQ